MTQTLATTPDTNDIFIGSNGNLVMLTGQDAVAGACNTASRASLGEEVLSTTSGLPFFQAVFIGVPNLPAYENALRETLQNVNGVVAVGSITSSVTPAQSGKAKLKYVAQVESEFGLTFTASREIVSP